MIYRILEVRGATGAGGKCPVFPALNSGVLPNWISCPPGVCLKGKNVPTYGSNSVAKNKTGKADEAEQITLYDSNYSLAAIIPQQKSPRQIGLSLSFTDNLRL